MSEPKLPPFDMNAPFDAPIRLREREEKEAHERAMKALDDPKVQATIRKIATQAAAKIGLRPLRKDGKPDRRYGPRVAPAPEQK